jgi:D-alanyl-D-alanine carboxypeptidase (penicillin-binding protein 5/6)
MMLKHVIFSSALGALLFVFFLSYSLYKTPAQSPVQFPAELTLDPSQIEAKAALVYDPAERRILFQKNASASLPLASLTKLMAAQTVLSGKNKNTAVTITLADIAPSGDWGFMVGDIIKLSDLVKMSLVASSNDAMAAAAASLGEDYMNQMNRTAGELGLSNTYFLNPTGLDLSDETSGAYGSAYDVARLAAAFMKKFPEYFALTAQEQVSIEDGKRTLSAKATALPLRGIPGFIGAKTGYTDLAGGNLVAAFDVDIGHPLILVVLGSSEAGRFTDIETLISASREAHNPTTP